MTYCIVVAVLLSTTVIYSTDNTISLTMSVQRSKVIERYVEVLKVVNFTQAMLRCNSIIDYKEALKTRATLELGLRQAIKGLIDMPGFARGRETYNEPDTQGKTMLMDAAELGMPLVVRVLLDGSADIHATDKNGHKALYYAQKFTKN